MDDLIFTADTVIPIFLVIGLGAVLRRTKVVNEEFVRRSNKIVFRVSLPLLIFAKLAARDAVGSAQGPAIGVFLAVTLAVFVSSWLAAARLIRMPPSRGAFVQGAFRSNIAIIGLPIVANMTGEAGVQLTVMLFAFAMPVYNVLAVIVLAATGRDAAGVRPGRMLLHILRNPLILAAVAGVVMGLLPFDLPRVAERTVTSLAQLTFPLALIGIGASLSGAMLRETAGLALAAAGVKNVLLPLGMTLAAAALGIRGTPLAVLFVVSGAPTAVSSFIMADAMQSDGRLAAGIVFCSTVCSLPSLFVGILVLRMIGAV